MSFRRMRKNAQRDWAKEKRPGNQVTELFAYFGWRVEPCLVAPDGRIDAPERELPRGVVTPLHVYACANGMVVRVSPSR
eukprot:2256369-Pleurochrysis_carterae.AAC.4